MCIAMQRMCHQLKPDSHIENATLYVPVTSISRGALEELQDGVSCGMTIQSFYSHIFSHFLMASVHSIRLEIVCT